jgi:hypothetical protein
MSFNYYRHYSQLDKEIGSAVREAGIAQSIQRRATGRTAGPGTRDVFIRHSVQAASGNQPNLLRIGYRQIFPGGQRGRGVKLTTHLKPVPKSRMVELSLNSPYVSVAWYLIKYRMSFIYSLSMLLKADMAKIGAHRQVKW